jgi:hypothetical protein
MRLELPPPLQAPTGIEFPFAVCEAEVEVDSSARRPENDKSPD